MEYLRGGMKLCTPFWSLFPRCTIPLPSSKLDLQKQSNTFYSLLGIICVHECMGWNKFAQKSVHNMVYFSCENVGRGDRQGRDMVWVIQEGGALGKNGTGY